MEVVRVRKLRDSPLDGSGSQENPGDSEVRAEVVLRSRLPFNLSACEVTMKLGRQQLPPSSSDHAGRHSVGHHHNIHSHGHGRNRRPSQHSPGHSPSSSLSWQSSGHSSGDLDSEFSVQDLEGSSRKQKFGVFHWNAESRNRRRE